MYCDSKLGNSAAKRVISTTETLADLAGHIVNCKLNEEPGSSFIVPREKWDESKKKMGSVKRRGEERRDKNLSLPPFPPSKSPIFRLFICQGGLGSKESSVCEEMRALAFH